MKKLQALSVLVAIALWAMSATLVNARGIDPGGVVNQNAAITMGQNGVITVAEVANGVQNNDVAPAIAPYSAPLVVGHRVAAAVVTSVNESSSKAARYQEAENTDYRAGIVSGSSLVQALLAGEFTDYRADINSSLPVAYQTSSAWGIFFG